MQKPGPERAFVHDDRDQSLDVFIEALAADIARGGRIPAAMRETVEGHHNPFAPGTLEDFTSDKTQLDRELEAIASTSQVDAELEKLKAEVGAGAPQKELEQ